MTTNLFTVENQTALNYIIHNSAEGCPVDGRSCDWCASFKKATNLVHTLAMTKGVVVTMTSNDVPVEVNGHYQAWCEHCCDGVNDTFLECTYWVRVHARTGHEILS